MDEQSTEPTPTRRDRRQAQQRRQRRSLLIGLGIVVVIALAIGGVVVLHHSKSTSSASATTTTLHATVGATGRTATGATSKKPAASTTTTTQAPGPGFVPGHITAVGDSVMLDYQQPLEQAIPGITVDAAVSRQWYEGEDLLTQLKAADQLGATVVVALGTNGPITDQDFDQMMSILQGASKVVFVNTHVDQPWQDPNNAVLAAGVKRYPNTVLVDWYALAAQNPGWFGPDETHLAIDGAGTSQMASLIANAVN